MSIVEVPQQQMDTPDEAKSGTSSSQQIETGTFKTGPWSISECNELQYLVSSLGNRWATIEVVMNRRADSCRDKYRRMHRKRRKKVAR